LLLKNAPVLFNEQVAANLYHVGFECPDIARRVQPGQFLMIRVAREFDPLLRRPFAVHRLESACIEILYRVVGRGTSILAGLTPGDSINILGPLGRGFRLPSGGGPILLVAGGIGIAPLPFLAEILLAAGNTGPHYLLFGAGKAEELVCVDHLEDLGFVTTVVTEDGSSGEKGLVTDHLERWLDGQQQLPVLIYSCGPYAMQRKVAHCALRFGIPCQLSMEALMACGVGACLGCSLRCKPPASETEPYYANVCQHGPVFTAEEIIWEQC